LREVSFRQRQIIHLASASYGHTGARRRVGEEDGSHADAVQNDRCRRLEDLLPWKAVRLAGHFDVEIDYIAAL
jgi:hypothetical protein